MNIDPSTIASNLENLDLSFLDRVLELLKTYTAAIPTSAAAVILIIVGLKLGKSLLKTIGYALVFAALLFYVLKI